MWIVAVLLVLYNVGEREHTTIYYYFVISYVIYLKKLTA